MSQVLIGVDAGTSNVKAVAFENNGRPITRSVHENPIACTPSGFAEQDPIKVWNATANALQSVIDALSSDQTVLGVGVTGQGHGCWLIDHNGAPVRDAILWSDSRSAQILETWADDGTLTEIEAICGSKPYSGTSLPILRWLADEEPETLSAAETVFSCKDWLKYKLTSTRTVDTTEASVPYLDIDDGEVSTDVFDTAGLDEHSKLLPPVISSTDIAGTVTSSAETETGVPEGTPVVGGLIDTAASAVGTGACKPGETSSIIGTALINLTLTNGPRPKSPGLSMNTSMNDLWTNVIGSRAGTNNLEWIRNEILSGAEFGELEDMASKVPVGSAGVRYLPFLSQTGEDGPFSDPDARAQFIGLEPSHSAAHLVRATYEGVALGMRDCYEHLPGTADRIHIGGGGAKSLFWTQMLADCLGADVIVPQGAEFGAKGSALLAGIATDEYSDIQEAVSRTTTVERVHNPDPNRRRQYDQLYDLYSDLVSEMGTVWTRSREVQDQLDSD